MTDVRKSQSERATTDESLRHERARADEELVKREEQAADAIVRRARGNADEILARARAKADERLAQSVQVPVGEGASLTQDRLSEDEALRSERAYADAELRESRAQQARVLGQLLPLEREKTDLSLLTERLRSDKAISQRDDFLSIVTHDLRNLLSGIVLSAEALTSDAEDGTESPDKTLATTARIERYAARMNRLIGDLVDVGSIDEGRLAVEPKRGDLAPLVSEALDAFQRAAEAKAISLETSVLQRPLPADFDPDRIMQVLANLISNAIKFSERKSKIQVRCETIDQEIQFVIADTGIGIPDAMLESVFERFWQVGKDDRRGLGLGLYISRCIIEAHGGRIWAESQLGQGSRFYFKLPAARA